MTKTWITVAAVVLAASLAGAQSQAPKPAAAPQPAGQAAAPAQQPQQAAPPAVKQPTVKTKEEGEALQKLFGDQTLTPDQKITLAEEFLLRFPKSEFKTMVLLEEVKACQQKNDFPNMLDFGEKVLKEEPENAITLILLSTTIPERTGENDLDRDVKLGKAESYAKRALAAIDKLPKMNPQTSDEDWDKVRNDARGQVWAGLGLVAMVRKQFTAAEEAFQKAASLQMRQDPVAYWRLGLALQGNKKYAEAREALKKSVAAGGVKVGGRDLAADELKRVEDFLSRQSGQTAAPPPQAPKP